MNGDGIRAEPAALVVRDLVRIRGYGYGYGGASTISTAIRAAHDIDRGKSGDEYEE
jgi:hypothetical protein